MGTAGACPAYSGKMAFFFQGAAFCVSHTLTALLDKNPLCMPVEWSAVQRRRLRARFRPGSTREHREQNCEDESHRDNSLLRPKWTDRTEAHIDFRNAIVQFASHASMIRSGKKRCER